MSDRFTALLSDYLDHDLARAEEDSVRRHLDTCADCREVLESLAAVKACAATLVDPPAPADLWAGIASRIGTAGSTSAVPAHGTLIEMPVRRRRWTLWQPLAAAAAFVAVVGGAAWLTHQWIPGCAGRGPLQAGRPAADNVIVDGSFNANEIEGEIGQLQRALDRGRGKLDPKTVQVLEENLRIIGKATEEARSALARDPANRDLQDYLAGSVMRKLDLVKRAAVMAGV